MSFEHRRTGGGGGGEAGGGGGGGEVGKRTLTDRLQPKLALGSPGGAYEAEADTVATSVSRTLAGGAAPSAPLAVTPVGTSVQGKEAGAAEVPASVHAAMGGGGQALAPDVGAKMSTAFGGHDFSGVRVHTGGAAAQASQDLGAAAYTVGSDVFFGSGQYQPHSPGGQELLAHELTHTVQQRGATVAQRQLIQRHPGVPPPTTTTAPTAGAAPEDRTDNEGNTYRVAAGKTYLVGPPRTAVPNHSGKPAALPANPNERSAALHAQVAAAAAQQGAYARGLKGGTNPPSNYRYWFARVYELVTQAEQRAIAAGTYQYPLMKMQEVIWFQNAYQANCDAWDAGNRARVEPHWRAAFAAAESRHSRNVTDTSATLARGGGAVGGAAVGAAGGAAAGAWFFGIGAIPGALIGAAGGALVGALAGPTIGDAMTEGSRAVLSALLPSMQAHIRFDLPRAIAGCYGAYYAGIPGLSMGDFQPDFDAMGPVFEAAQAALNPEIQLACGNTDPGTWGVAQAAFPMFFDVAKERSTTWLKAQALEASRAAGDDNLTAGRKMRARTAVSAPISGASNYQVDGQDIGDEGFDWQHNPGTAPAQTGPTGTP
jgi:hypothetical protein